jgi:2-polyprenyl-3-methyl-5-hydroxy-6-metoxy-1,4-benzoquinol methylase
MQSHNQARDVTLVCPACRVELIHSQSYVCPLCGSQYPFRGGVLRMLGEVDRQEQRTRAAFDFEHRQFDRARYLRIGSTLVDDWLKDVKLPKEYFVGRTVLDLGCGSGRWTYALAMLGARVLAVDFTDAAVDITREVTKHLPNVEVIQANLFRLPFKPEQFDFVVSWGVLHHTVNTREAFRTVAPLVRPQGILHVMVYERRNPLKVAGTELLRIVLRRLSPERRYRICGRLVVKNRLVFHLLRGFIACVPVHELTPAFDAEAAQFGLYDWYSPPYNHLHSVSEVRRWFEQEGFSDIHVTTPIKYTDRLDVFRFGECGGSISIRGQKGLTADRAVEVREELPNFRGHDESIVQVNMISETRMTGFADGWRKRGDPSS